MMRKRHGQRPTTVMNPKNLDALCTQHSLTLFFFSVFSFRKPMVSWATTAVPKTYQLLWDVLYWYFVTLLRWLIAWFEGPYKVDVMAAPFLFIVLCDQVLEKDKKKDKKITSISYCTGQFQADLFGNSCILYTLYTVVKANANDYCPMHKL